MVGAKRRRTLISSGVTILATGCVALMLTACGAGAAQKPAASSGGVVNWAEQPQGTPNFIFPFMPINYFSVANISQFQYMMFRPLYFFGTGSQPTLNSSLSLASAPKYSNGNKTVTINMKTNYKWSNGEAVDAQDALFFFNMLKTDKSHWAAYAPGTIPDDIASITTPSKYKLVVNLTGSVNPYWFTYNELSQITPMPLAWDVTSTSAKAGSAACATSTYAALVVDAKGAPTNAAAKACDAVYTFLSSQSGYDPANPSAANNSLATYATNPLWQVVDGPWHLTAFSSTGAASFKPNAKYDGPIKAKISQFNELPFTSTSSEYSALLGGKLQYGYLPPEDVTKATKNPTKPAGNPPSLKGFQMNPVYVWGINYFPYNFNSSGDGGQAGKIFSQLYFRQAFQMLVDQPLFIDKFFKGYAVPTYGPVPVLPKNPFASSYEKSNPYPFSSSKAVKLLKDHGWKVVPGGVSTCSVAAKCGVPVGTKLSFTEQYVNQGPIAQEEANAEVSSWESAGIKVSLSTGTFNTVIGNAIPCKAGAASCTWELENWEGGWLYAPDYYPTGEEIFQTGAGSNVGNYDVPANDALIKATDFSSANLTNWENYITKNLPFVWQPNQAYDLYEISSKVHNATPINPLLNLTPETWTLSS